MRGQSYSNKLDNSNKEDFQGGETKVMKKSLKMLLIFSLVFTMFAPALALAEEEVELDAQAKFEVMVEAGILEGIDGEAALDKNMQRNEVAKILANIFELEVVADAATPFPDEPADNWGYTDGYIQAVEAEGLMIGGEKEDGTIGFRPSAQLSVQELAVVLARALGLELDADAEVEGKTSSWATPHVAAVLAAELLSASADFTVDATRGDLVNSTYAVYVYVEEMKAAEEAAKEAKVESVTAINLAEVEVKYNQEVDASSLSLTNVSVGANSLSATSGAITLLEDGKTVRIFKNDGFVSAQEAKAKISLSGVKSTSEKEFPNVELQELTFIDLAFPTITSVESVGNTKLVVTFSEAVRSNNDLKIFANYRINDTAVVGSGQPTLSSNGRVLEVELANSLSAGEHEFNVVANKFVDFAGFAVGVAKHNFTVNEDKTLPTVSLESASQNSVKVKFSKEVKNADVASNIYWKDGNVVKQAQSSVRSSSDRTVYTITFSDANALPLTSTTLYFSNIRDYFGNQSTTAMELTVQAQADIVRPEVTGVTSLAENATVITFNKNVRVGAGASGTVIVKDKNGTEVVNTSVSALSHRVVGSTTHSNTILITTGLNTANNPFTVEVKEVEDQSVLKNKMLPYVTTLTVVDVTRPTVSGAVYVDTNTRNVVINFSESVNSTTAVNASNYLYQDTLYGFQPLPSTASLSLSGNALTISFPATWTVNGATRNFADQVGVTGRTFQIANIEDLVGNVMFTQNITTNTTVPGVAKFATAEATGQNTIFVPVTGQLPTVAYASDFVVSAIAIDSTVSYLTVTAATIKTSAPAGITLTVAQNLNSDGSYRINADNTNSAVTVALANPVQLTKDAYGRAITGTAVGLVDEIGPSFTELAVTTGGVVTLSFNEVVKANAPVVGDATGIASALVVKHANGTLVPNVDYTTSIVSGKLVITVIKAGFSAPLTEISLNVAALTDTSPQNNAVNSFSTSTSGVVVTP